MLASSGAHVIVPYLRGFGPTRFLSGSTMRSGQQAALGRDLIGLLDGLSIETAIVAGFALRLREWAIDARAAFMRRRMIPVASVESFMDKLERDEKVMIDGVQFKLARD